jgi:FtsZ-interacting cell division protein ZipA
VLQAYYQPYNSPHKNSMADAVGVALSLTYYLTLLVKALPIATDKDALGVLLLLLLVAVVLAAIAAVWAMRRQTEMVLRDRKRKEEQQQQDGPRTADVEMRSTVIENPAYAASGAAEEEEDDEGAEEGEGRRAVELEAEMAAMKREHSKYTSARVAAELQKAQTMHAAELEAARAEAQAAQTEAAEAKAELALLKAKTE